jgi:hypothetical protein
VNFHIPELLKKAEWYTKWGESGDVRPYVYVRPDNKISSPGSRHHSNWFPMEPIYKNPLDTHELEFAEQIYFIEGRAFGPSNMAMPRWVFYDCAIIPGFVAGFAMRTSKLPDSIRKVMRTDPTMEWTPLSLFIIIPTMAKGQWVAHNLCAINSLLPEQDRLYGLGFLSKAFGLWYANVESCLGMTQWGSPALKLHSHYGHMQIVTAYTPVHSHAKTITYRVEVDTLCWEKFFNRETDYGFLEQFGPSGLIIDPQSETSMIELHDRIQRGEGPYYLNAADIATQKLTDPLPVYQPKRAF